MKITETYTYYVIYNITKEEYFSNTEELKYYNYHYKTEYNFNKLIKNAIYYDTRKEANNYIKELIDINNIDKYVVKKVKVDYFISK